MRILFVHRWVGVRLGGTETHVKELMARLAERGHEVHLVTLRRDAFGPLAERLVVHEIRPGPGEDLRSYRPWDPRLYLYTALYAAKIAVAMLHLARRHAFDVVSVHFVTESWVARLLRPLTRSPYVFVMEGYTDHEARAAKKADLTVAITRAVARRCRARHRYDPVVIPIGVDRTRFHPADRAVRARARRLLSVGRLVPEKNYSLLLRAFARARSFLPDLTLDIVGEGRERTAIEAMVRDLGLQGSVRLRGLVPEERLADAYRNADVFLVTQDALDEFWIAGLEAMACGLPILATSPRGALEVVGDAGLVAPVGDAEAFAQLIMRLATDEGLYRSLASRALERVEQYDWNRLIPRYEEAYASAARSRGHEAERRAVSVPRETSGAAER